MSRPLTEAPGRYVPDVSEQIERLEDLPAPLVVAVNRDYRQLPCPRCQQPAPRLRRRRRVLHDVGDAFSGRPRELHVSCSQHYCPRCPCYFSAPCQDLAPPQAHYTHRVIDRAVRVVVEDGLPYRSATWQLWRDHWVFAPFATIQNWVEAAGEKSSSADAGAVPG